MMREPVITVRRPAVGRWLEHHGPGDWKGTQGRRPRDRGLARRVTDRLYDLVDRGTRERYEHRRLPL